MAAPPRWRLVDTAMLLVVVLTAAAARVGFLWECADWGKAPAPLQVQTPLLLPGQARPSDVDELVSSLARGRFACRAPLAEREEDTAHVAPGYYWFFAALGSWFSTPEEADQVMRWLQAGLGTLTAAFYFFFARRAFHSSGIASIAGLLCAVHPFWIINTAELNDGVLATFLLAACLMIGTRASQVGGPLTSLLFGLSLAALAMVRAALLPFAVAALVWFLCCCRSMPRGWFFALVAVLGFGNGLAPWTVRNFQTFGMAVPIADSAMLHLWIGNQPTAARKDESAALKLIKVGMDSKQVVIARVEAERQALLMGSSLSTARRQELEGESNQARRYNRMSADVAEAVRAEPGAAVSRRLWAGVTFFFGEVWLLTRGSWTAGTAGSSAWLKHADGLLSGAFLGMMVLAVLGWRWSHGWRAHARLATFAVLWLPLPYLLSHGDVLSGQRLPLDGVLLCFAAFALGGCFIPKEPGK